MAVLNNFDEGSPGDIARMLAAVALDIPVPKFTTITLSNNQLKPMMGKYKLASGDVRHIFMEDNKVYSVRGEGHKFQIFPMSEHSFYYERNLSYFTIEKNAQGQQVMNFYDNLSTTPQVAVKQ